MPTKNIPKGHRGHETTAHVNFRLILARGQGPQVPNEEYLDRLFLQSMTYDEGALLREAATRKGHAAVRGVVPGLGPVGGHRTTDRGGQDRIPGTGDRGLDRQEKGKDHLLDHGGTADRDLTAGVSGRKDIERNF